MPKNIEDEIIKGKTKKNVVEKGKAVGNKNTVVNSKKLKEKGEKQLKSKIKKQPAKSVLNKSSLKTKNVNKAINEKRKAKTTQTKTKNNNEVSLENRKVEYLNEYYDLPFRYNDTIVTILAQTPKRLFVYWDISDKDRENYIKAFGDDFFEKTYPVLLVHNEEMDYTFEVPINDFANSWYLDIQDSKKNYVVQLGRKFKQVEQAKIINTEIAKEAGINLQNDYIHITSSNKLEAPNDHILFELLSNQVKYRNVKTGEEYFKNIKDLIKDLNNVYSSKIIYDLYNKLYLDELKREDFGRKNPASSELGLPTSSGALRSSGQW